MSDEVSVSASLNEALAKYEIELPADQVERLDHYCQMLWQWNEKLNLTRHTDYDRFVSRDVVDTLELSKLLNEAEDVLDLGTGGGVPGIILAIVRPDLKVSLCESVGKKAKVLDLMLQDLELPVPIYNARVEDLLEDFRFDVVVARAVGPLWKLCFWLNDHWFSAGRLLAIKGPAWVEERAEARHRSLMNDVEMRCVATYPMPETESESVILKLWAKGTPEK